MNVACSICLESFTLTSDIYTTPCGHVFHYECIRKWLERGNPNCSLCRQNCDINEITRLHFSENEAALEENYVYTQLESENLKLQKEVNESKAREWRANKKSTKLESENLRLRKQINESKARELEANKVCNDLQQGFAALAQMAPIKPLFDGSSTPTPSVVGFGAPTSTATSFGTPSGTR